jgi:hypothetical protein
MKVTNKIRVEIQIEKFKFPAHTTVEDVPENIQRHPRFRQLVERNTLVIEKPKRKTKKVEKTEEEPKEEDGWFLGDA